MSRHDVMIAERHPAHERPLKDLFTELTRDLSTLFRKEAELAKAELNVMLGRIAKQGVAMGVGGALLHAGVLALVAALILGLVAAGVPAWLAAAAVGGTAALVGYALAGKAAERLKDTDVTPRRAIRQAKETVEWAKEEAT